MMPGMPGSAPLLLLSMPQMADPNFARAVVLLCDYTADGAFGLVVNRQMTEPAWTMVKTEPPSPWIAILRLWHGGPVAPQKTWVLMSEAHGPEDEQRGDLPGRAAVGVARAHDAAAAGAADDTRPRRWSATRAGAQGQLEQELASSSWLLTDVDPQLIFGVPAEEMWETAIRRLGADPAALQMSPGVH
jgi:putative transcriptional regulator